MALFGATMSNGSQPDAAQNQPTSFMVSFPYTDAALDAPGMASIFASRGQRGLFQQAEKTLTEQNFIPITKGIAAQRELNPTLRAVIVQGGPPADTAKALYLALWKDMEDAVHRPAGDPALRDQWTPLLDDARQSEAETFLQALMRQPPARGKGPGALSLLTRVQQHRDIFEALTGDQNASEMIKFLADPVWGEGNGRLGPDQRPLTIPRMVR